MELVKLVQISREHKKKEDDVEQIHVVTERNCYKQVNVNNALIIKFRMMIKLIANSHFVQKDIGFQKNCEEKLRDGFGACQ